MHASEVYVDEYAIGNTCIIHVHCGEVSMGIQSCARHCMQIQKIDRNLLDVNQWKHLNRTLPQTNQ